MKYFSCEKSAYVNLTLNEHLHFNLQICIHLHMVMNTNKYIHILRSIHISKLKTITKHKYRNYITNIYIALQDDRR